MASSPRPLQVVPGMWLGREGFEPPNAGSKAPRLAAGRRPSIRVPCTYDRPHSDPDGRAAHGSGPPSTPSPRVSPARGSAARDPASAPRRTPSARCPTSPRPARPRPAAPPSSCPIARQRGLDHALEVVRRAPPPLAPRCRVAQRRRITRCVPVGSAYTSPRAPARTSRAWPAATPGFTSTSAQPPGLPSGSRRSPRPVPSAGAAAQEERHVHPEPHRQLHQALARPAEPPEPVEPHERRRRVARSAARARPPPGSACRASIRTPRSTPAASRSSRAARDDQVAARRWAGRDRSAEARVVGRPPASDDRRDPPPASPWRSRGSRRAACPAPRGPG